jgi:NitT/TauT family transport system substrate-binding protein
MKYVAILFLILFCSLDFYGQQKENTLREVVFNTSWYPQAQFAGYFIAEKKGFYKKRGIDTKFILSTFNGGVEENLSEGKADLGIMWLHEGIVAHSKNNKIVNIAQFVDTSNILIVARNKKIKSIGIWKPYLDFLKAYIHKEISDTIEIVPLRNGNEAFIYGAVDAVTAMSYNEYNQLINSGVDEKDVHVIKLSKKKFLLPEDGIYCSQEFYEKNKKLCADFIDASVEGWNYAFKNIDEAVRICFEYIKNSNYNTNVTIQRLMLNTIKNSTNNGRLDIEHSKLNKESFDKMVNFLEKTGLISSKINYAQFYKGY